LDEQPFHSVYSVAEALSVSHLAILSHLWGTLDMKIFHLRWIPHELATNLRQIRVETCQELLSVLKAHEKQEFQRFVTEDDSWFTLEFHHSMKWSVSREDIPQKTNQQVGTQKLMLPSFGESMDSTSLS
jgi:hypothetical protein